MPVSRRLAAVAAALVLASSMAACSSDSNEASGTPTPTVTTPAASPQGSPSSVPQVCQEITQARLSMLKVTSVPVVAQGRDAIQAQWEVAKVDMQTAVDSARSQFPTEAQALEDSIDRMQTAVDALEETPSADALAELGKAVGAATVAVTALNSALRETC